MRVGKLIAAAALIWAGSLVVVWPSLSSAVSPILHAQSERDRSDRGDANLDKRVAAALKQWGFTGTIESQLTKRLGRPINDELADLGRLLWFDPIHSLHQDNSCAGCHSPTNGFGDTQSIAIGIDNNNKVGPNRTGPRNQRRSPMIINTAFFPKLMWNGRFFANPSMPYTLGNPFSNANGFTFPDPESTTMFPPGDDIALHLLHAQAFIPPTELVEVAGFTGTKGTIAPEFDQFDNGVGHKVPLPDESGFRNEPIRQKGLRQLNKNARYKAMFGRLFPEARGPHGAIDFKMFGRAIAEFEFMLTFADAPIDQFARGNRSAMSAAEKRGALVFFGEGRCVICHAVKGASNEMFSDFQNRVAGIPQIAPYFGVGRSNMIYDGDGKDEDFGAQQISGEPEDRYKFRTAPLRNAALSPAFFHNGSFTDLGDAIRYHLDAEKFGPRYSAKEAGVDKDLTRRLGPIRPVLRRLDPELRGGIDLRESEIEDLIQFVTTGLLDKRATKENLCKLVPQTLPSGMRPFEYEGCIKLLKKRD